jgi:hypothetical protein
MITRVVLKVKENKKMFEYPLDLRQFAASGFVLNYIGMKPTTVAARSKI